MAKGEPFKYRVYKAMTHKADHKWIWFTFDIFMVLLIVISVTISVLKALIPNSKFYDHYELLDFICLGIFAVEWLLHFYAAEYFYPDAGGKWKAKWKWFISFSSIIDLICLCTLVLDFIPRDVAYRYLRLIKLVKLLKLKEYFWFLEEKE